MIKKEEILKLVEEFLAGTDRFVVKLSVGKEDKINIYIDGDSAVSIDDCIAVSRYIESNLDRDKEDFELSVSSAGIGEPFLHIRQFKNKIDKAVEILLEDGTKFKAILLGVNDNEINVAKEVKSKKKKSKMFTTGESELISLKNIKYTKEIITI